MNSNAVGTEQHMNNKPARVTVKDFIILAKPGIIISNSLAAFSGFWMAWLHSEKTGEGHNILVTMAIAMIGTAFVMASSTVFNNCFDRNMDAKMARTRNRATVTGKIPPSAIITFGTCLGAAGLGMLASLNILAATLGLSAFLLYAVVYTLWFKRHSVWSTFIGSFPGAAPPLIGYCALTGYIDMPAVILYAIMFLWQPPHFWAIGIRRKEEYRAAGIPLLPVIKGNHMTKIKMMRYILILAAVTLLVPFYVHVSPFYAVSALILGAIWVYKGIRGFTSADDIQWAKGMFIYSIVYFSLLFIIMMADSLVTAFFIP
ncbi:heme o synthase [Bacillus sp. ISL-51]|uniref:heme o synthase n=1 Tax=Bacteria TaxID=2 RepID=UPI001BEAC7AE|nr:MULTISPECIES: heme o synthase [Bacteria]MBT2572419.1 heme o synthase [Bacillus sp. ISL-51]MBT2634355.1 heme o synthase [Bacillus sp. ISL-26]MBT2711480.1 heme o synthase [Pseudomonas sp. ISL-88]